MESLPEKKEFHAQTKLTKSEELKENSFNNINVYYPLQDHLSYIISNQKYIAFTSQGGGAPLSILESQAYGDYKGKQEKLILNGHSKPLVQMHFPRFSHNMLMTLAEDAKFNIWKINDQIFEEEEKIIEREPFNSIQTDYNFVQSFLSPDYIKHLAILCGDKGVFKFYDIGENKLIQEVQLGSMDKIHSMQLTCEKDGNILICGDINCNMSIFDCRNSSSCSETIKTKLKKQRLIMCEDSPLVISMGIEQQYRKAKVYDIRNLSKEISTTTIDSKNQTFFRLYDTDTRTIFVYNRGSLNLKALALKDNTSVISLCDIPMLYDIGCLSLIPKHMCNVKRVEYSRVLNLTRKIPAIKSISLLVPKRRVRIFRAEFFHDELFPDTEIEPIEQLYNVSEWLTTEQPPIVKKYMSLKPQEMTKITEQESDLPVVSSKMLEMKVKLKKEEEVKLQLQKRDANLNNWLEQKKKKIRGKFDASDSDSDSDKKEKDSDSDWSD